MSAIKHHHTAGHQTTSNAVKLEKVKLQEQRGKESLAEKLAKMGMSPTQIQGILAQVNGPHKPAAPKPAPTPAPVAPPAPVASGTPVYGVPSTYTPAPVDVSQANQAAMYQLQAQSAYQQMMVMEQVAFAQVSYNPYLTATSQGWGGWSAAASVRY